MNIELEYQVRLRDKCFEEFPTLETKRFILCRYNEIFLKDIEELFSDKEVMKYSGTEIIDAKKQANMYLEKVEMMYRNKEGIRWVIVDKITNEFLGDMGLYNIDLYSNNTEIGYTVVRRHWREKIASECIERLLKFVFKELYMNKIIAMIDRDNFPSIALAKKIGFCEDGVLREHYYNYQVGGYGNISVYSMLRKEYMKQN
ncbi:GNAT family N-acetyltransferase [Clostridium sp. UBA6640]|uniref:GNAT family N-acetyltransferase n=1 Tax=Clostridium sp. UBA6640 TaxID=1946370 RepID=UPI0025BBB410|nr:GNAT family N-acetyltransferase [Clostridium sp. UBA6640]